MIEYRITLDALEKHLQTGNEIEALCILEGVEGKIMDAHVEHNRLYNGNRILVLHAEDGSMKMVEKKIVFETKGVTDASDQEN